MTDAAECEALLDAALARGLNVRVGIGENPLAHRTATNAELVEPVVEMIHRRGLEPTTPAAVAARLGLPGREAPTR